MFVATNVQAEVDVGRSMYALIIQGSRVAMGRRKRRVLLQPATVF
jgi:hypothetical protein